MSEKQYKPLVRNIDVIQLGDERGSDATGWSKCRGYELGEAVPVNDYYRRPITSSPEGETIQGKKISKEEAYSGLGNPDSWSKGPSPTTEPVVRVTEKHRQAAYKIGRQCVATVAKLNEEIAAEILAKHFPEPASDWIERAAEELDSESYYHTLKEKRISRFADIITRHCTAREGKV